MTARPDGTKNPLVRTKVAVSLIVVGGCVIYLLSQSFGEQMVYAKYVDELVRDQRELRDRTVRLEGMVDEGSIENRPGTLEYRFRLSKGGKTLPVHYTGIVPDTFREGIGVVAQGRLNTRGVFVADQVIAKCPSKYEMEAKRGKGVKAPHAPR